MNENRAPRRGLRTAGALIAGFLTIVVLSIATDALLHGTGVFPPIGQPMSDARYAVALAYRIVYGIAGCYVAARLAPDRPMRHAMILGVVGVVLSTAGAIAMWKVGPPWYPLAVIAISIPCAWAGARLHRA